MSFFNFFASDASQHNPPQPVQKDNGKEKDEDVIFDLESPSSEVSIRSAAITSKASSRVSFTSAASNSNESVVATKTKSENTNFFQKDAGNKKERGVSFDLGTKPSGKKKERGVTFDLGPQPSKFNCFRGSSTTSSPKAKKKKSKGKVSDEREQNRYSNNLSLTYKQMEMCEEVFVAFETENGTVDADYLPTMVPALVVNGDPGRKPTERELKHLAKAIQANGEVLDFNLFLHIVAPYIRRANVKFSKQQIDAAFKRFDIDGNGYITASELKTILRSCFGKEMRDVANNLDADDIQEIMVEADLDGDGRISYSEFAAIIPHLSDGVYIGLIESNSLEWA